MYLKTTGPKVKMSGREESMTLRISILFDGTSGLNGSIYLKKRYNQFQKGHWGSASWVSAVMREWKKI
jgi:hypothetical protein